MTILGDWDVKIRTPVGSLQIVYRFYVDDGVLLGEAAGTSETVPCTDIAVIESADGHRVRWRQAVTKPMKLNLDFDVLVQGDQLDGHSRAGRLPRSRVTGTRRR
ncbi:hypothetical protein [Mycolicibacterium goodii]|uniref:Uncharacterized protein n=1 Tax=Mycolicibacterium goodii TaxID=134601 RepID=A0A0K0X5G3_MYCGD|nr:hypothetical protein AFA91_12830 [Mycolicibacterium goodii]